MTLLRRTQSIPYKIKWKDTIFSPGQLVQLVDQRESVRNTFGHTSTGIQFEGASLPRDKSMDSMPHGELGANTSKSLAHAKSALEVEMTKFWGSMHTRTQGTASLYTINLVGESEPRSGYILAKRSRSTSLTVVRLLRYHHAAIGGKQRLANETCMAACY